MESPLARDRLSPHDPRPPADRVFVNLTNLISLPSSYTEARLVAFLRDKIPPRVIKTLNPFSAARRFFKVQRKNYDNIPRNDGGMEGEPTPLIVFANIQTH